MSILEKLALKHPINAFVDSGFSGSTPEEWQAHVEKKQPYLRGLLGAHLVGTGALLGSSIGAMEDRPGLGAGIGAGVGALGSIPAILAMRKEFKETTPEQWDEGFKIHQERNPVPETKEAGFGSQLRDSILFGPIVGGAEEARRLKEKEKDSPKEETLPGKMDAPDPAHPKYKEQQAKQAFDQGYADALSKLGYNSAKLQRVGGGKVINPKATAGSPAAQAVIPKATKARYSLKRSDAGF